MADLFQSLSPDVRKRLKKRKYPSWIDPMLAVLTHDRFSDEKWIFERKLDGERCLAFRQGKSVRLLSRNRKELNATYPELVDALDAQSVDNFVVDGEIVAFKGKLTSFARLQHRMQIKDAGEARATGIAVYYYVFDLLYLEDCSTLDLSLRDRKLLLRKSLSYDDPLRFTTHRNTEGEKYYGEACQKGWEGLIAKQATGRYVQGRSKKWLKFKCVNQQEFVIGGYTDPEGERTGFGALLIGYYENDALQYAGKVGTGYDEETLNNLAKRLSRLERKSPPFTGSELPETGVHWVTPKLVGEVAFTEWTRDGKLRHPRFLGLRRDKEPESVVREQAHS
jgi:DNA ligase D-like protein (predicted ligase)